MWLLRAPFFFILFFITCSPSHEHAFNEKNLSRVLKKTQTDNVKYYTNALENPSKICIASHFDRAIGSYAQYTVQNHVRYAKKYNYKYFLFHDESDLDLEKFTGNSVPYFWVKPEIFKTIIVDKKEKIDCNWLLWIDSDAIFTNKNGKIEDIIDFFGKEKQSKKEYDIFVTTEDRLEQAIITSGSVFLNAGVLLMKNSDLSRQFIKDWVHLGTTICKGADQHDQGVLIDLTFQTDGLMCGNNHGLYQERSFSHVRDGVKIVRARVMNALSHISGTIKKQYFQWQPCDFILHAAGTSKGLREGFFSQYALTLGNECQEHPWVGLKNFTHPDHVQQDQKDFNETVFEDFF